MDKDKLFWKVRDGLKLSESRNSEVNAFCISLWSCITDDRYEWHKEKVAIEEVKWAEKADRRMESEIKRRVEEEVKRLEKKRFEEMQAGIMTDEERANAVMRFLDGKLNDGTLTAAELAQFKDIFNLKARDQDIQIEMTNYGGVGGDDVDGAKIMAAVGMMIEEANK